VEHSFDVEKAVELGVEAAIVIKWHQFWILTNKANHRHFHDGRNWTYNSIEALSKIFPYWTPRQIRRIIDGLIRAGILITGSYSAKKNDRTLWYAFEDETAFLSDYDILPNGQIILPIGHTKQSNPFYQTVKSILPNGQMIGTDTKEPVIPSYEDNRTPLSFAREINEIILAKTNSDWKAYLNIAKKILSGIKSGKCTQASFEQVMSIAKEAAEAKVDKPIALFYTLLQERMDYKRQAYKGSQLLGNVFKSMVPARAEAI
jgi:hypothetical protein